MTSSRSLFIQLCTRVVLWVHNIVSSTVCQRLPQNTFHPILPRTDPPLRRPKTFPVISPCFPHILSRKSSELYNLEMTCQNPSATDSSILLNLLLRTFLDYGLVPGDTKGQTRWQWWNLNHDRIDPSLKQRTPTTRPIIAGCCYFDIMFFFFLRLDLQKMKINLKVSADISCNCMQNSDNVYGQWRTTRNLYRSLIWNWVLHPLILLHNAVNCHWTIISLKFQCTFCLWFYIFRNSSQIALLKLGDKLRVWRHLEFSWN